MGKFFYENYLVGGGHYRHKRNGRSHEGKEPSFNCIKSENFFQHTSLYAKLNSKQQSRRKYESYGRHYVFIIYISITSQKPLQINKTAIFFNHSLNAGHSGCFCHFSYTNKATMNILIYWCGRMWVLKGRTQNYT